jgi:probable HAF family extracellular repeat protein
MQSTTFIFTLAMVAISPSSWSLQQYTLKDLGVLPQGNTSEATGINSLGQVVGTGDLGGDKHAVRYTDKIGLEDLGTLGGASSAGYGINDNGQVVGESKFSPDSDLSHAFRYTDDNGMEDLGSFDNRLPSVAFGINNDGTVTGKSGFKFDDPLSSYHAFRYTDTNGLEDLGTLAFISSGNTINQLGQIAGTSTEFNGTSSAFRYTDITGMVDLGIGSGSSANGMNDSGQVVGLSVFPINKQHAFRYSDANGIEDLGALPDADGSSVAYAINFRGQVVGESNKHAFLWTETDGMEDLNAIPVVSKLGWVLTSAKGINDRGQIAGTGINPDGQTHGYRLDPLTLPFLSIPPPVVGP